jgi:hypothetical protein
VASLGEVLGKEEPAFRSRKASRQRGKVVIKSSSGDESTQVPGASGSRCRRGGCLIDWATVYGLLPAEGQRSIFRAGEEDDHILSFSLRSCVRPVSRNGDEKVIPCQPLTLNGVLRRRVGLRSKLGKTFPC